LSDFFAAQGKILKEYARISRNFNAVRRKNRQKAVLVGFFKHALILYHETTLFVKFFCREKFAALSS